MLLETMEYTPAVVCSGECYSMQMKPLLAETPRRRRKTHSIQIVEVPATPDSRRGLHFSIEKQPSRNRLSVYKDVPESFASPQLKISK